MIKVKKNFVSLKILQNAALRIYHPGPKVQPLKCTDSYIHIPHVYSALFMQGYTFKGSLHS